MAVVIGSPGFRDNLELPLELHDRRDAAGADRLDADEPAAAIAGMRPLIVALTLMAIGFKEQGLVLVPLS